MRFVVREGPQAGRAFELQQAVIGIGRSKSSDIRIDEPLISRHHARLTRVGGDYVLEDLNSTNGTFVNGRRISVPTPIQPGDVVRLGDNVVMDVQASGGHDWAYDAQPAASGAALYPPPPPPPVEVGISPVRRLAIGCGCLLLAMVCVLVGGLLVYQFAPAELAVPLCDILRPLPGLGMLCP